MPAAFGLRPGGDAGSGGPAFQVGHIDHADFGNVHGLYLHLLETVISLDLAFFFFFFAFTFFPLRPKR